jgi:predicted nucleotidyltransferase
VSSGRRFAAARDAWRAVAARALDDDARVAGWGLVGSFGRGDADDWSDLDVLVIVEDADFAAYIDPTATYRSQLSTRYRSAASPAPTRSLCSTQMIRRERASVETGSPIRARPVAGPLQYLHDCASVILA